MTGTLTRLATDLDNLPTRGIDLNAAECVASLTQLLRSAVSQIKRSNSGELLVQAFIRGLAGDPFGTVSEQIEASDSLKGGLQACSDQFHKARIRLTDRYELEFPRIRLDNQGR
jgi:hypothetical protein